MTASGGWLPILYGTTKNKAQGRVSAFNYPTCKSCPKNASEKQVGAVHVEPAAVEISGNFLFASVEAGSGSY